MFLPIALFQPFRSLQMHTFQASLDIIDVIRIIPHGDVHGPIETKWVMGVEHQLLANSYRI